MKIEDLANKSEKELHKLLAQHREKLRDLKFKVANKELKNSQELKEVKRAIARILTILQSKKVKKD